MCLSIPAKVISTQGNMAIVQSGELKTRACLDLVDDIVEGDFVLIHTGFVIQKISQREAGETIRLIREIDQFNETP